MSTGVKLRGAVVGCGMIAEFHLRGWARLPEVEIAALVDPNRDAAERYRTAFASTARVYTDIDSLFAAEALDFVDIVTPPALHAAHCWRAKAANVHVICQKPLCSELADAHALVAAFASTPKLFCVHENHVFRPWFQRVRALSQEGALGPLRYIQLAQHDPNAPAQRFHRDGPRGVLLEYGVHLAAMIHALLGKPERVSAQLHRMHPEVRGESLAHVTFEYATATAVIDIAWKNDGLPHGGALFLGERGEAYYSGTMTRGGTASFRAKQGLRVVVDEVRETVADYTESFYLFQRDVIAAIRDGTAGPQPAPDNVHSLEMIFAAYAATERKAPVDFAEFTAAHHRAGGQGDRVPR